MADLEAMVPTEQQHCEGVVRKAVNMRLNAIAARGSVRELTEQRNQMIFARNDLGDCIRKEKDRVRHMPSGPWVQRSMDLVATFERGIQFLSDVLIPDVDARIETAEQIAQGQGLASERMQQMLHAEIEYMGVSSAI